MKKILAILFILLFVFGASGAFAYTFFSQRLCSDWRVHCHTVRWGETWESLFPNIEQRDIVMRLNRMNISLFGGAVIAIPKKLKYMTIMDIAPFAMKIPSGGEKKIVVDLNRQAWGAYDARGNLVHWGPASGGRGYCADDSQPCRTMTGNFKIIRKQPAGCVSHVYPLEYEGGAPMPYCMHFWNGYALHGSYELPGFNASHGCVRMFINDARWLNTKFAGLGTKVVIHGY
jgi:hypothetical protein